MLLRCSPMCTAHSFWQHMKNKILDPRIVEKEFSRARVHLEFCVGLYRGSWREAECFFTNILPERAPSKRGLCRGLRILMASSSRLPTSASTAWRTHGVLPSRSRR